MKIKAGEQEYDVEVADTFLSRAKGLSFRDEGKMFFRFSRPTNARIDMMFLSRPLYLYFFDSERKLIHSEKAEPWSFNPKTWRFYRPEKRYQYLLESFEDLGLEEGDRINF
ncbi:MAG: DUF192 domain-containing protein [Candidatus Nanohaloarchaea archaeon]